MGRRGLFCNKSFDGPCTLTEEGTSFSRRNVTQHLFAVLKGPCECFVTVLLHPTHGHARGSSWWQFEPELQRQLLNRMDIHHLPCRLPQGSPLPASPSTKCLMRSFLLGQ